MRLFVLRFAVAEEVQHHRCRPDGGDRIGDVLAGDIRRRAVHRFKQRWQFAVRIQIGRWRDADGAGAGRAEVGQDVAEQVGRDHDAKRCGLSTK